VVKMSRARQAGFTFVELLVATAILGIVSTICLDIMRVTQDLTTRTISEGSCHEQSRTLAERIARDLRFSSASSPNFNIPEGQECTLAAFRKCTGYDPQTSQLTWGPLLTYEFRAVSVSGETDVTDGIDNNGNGVVDEGGVYRQVENMNEVLIARDIDPAWFSLQRTGNAITIRVGIARPDPAVRGETITGRYETSVVLRN